MKEVFASVIFNFFCIFIFFIIYLYLKDEFIINIVDNKNAKSKNEIQIVDCMLYATTIQAGIGLTSIMPNTFLTKFITIIQQYIMLASYILILYFFFRTKNK